MSMKYVKYVGLQNEIIDYLNVQLDRYLESTNNFDRVPVAMEDI